MARHRQHTREFKLAALARMDAAPDVQALAVELGVERSMLYRWQRAYIRGGAEALRSTGRPRPVLMQPSEATAPMEEHQAPAAIAEAAANPMPPAAEASPEQEAKPLAAFDSASTARRIMELERKIGQQQLELDFFRAALRHVRAARR